jgi:hypothetical protein
MRDVEVKRKTSTERSEKREKPEGPLWFLCSLCFSVLVFS